jgi:hypothetical protein
MAFHYLAYLFSEDDCIRNGRRAICRYSLYNWPPIDTGVLQRSAAIDSSGLLGESPLIQSGIRLGSLQFLPGRYWNPLLVERHSPSSSHFGVLQPEKWSTGRDVSSHNQSTFRLTATASNAMLPFRLPRGVSTPLTPYFPAFGVQERGLPGDLSSTHTYVYI